MSFLQPWMLLGLLTAALPIVIHLIFRSRPRRQPFPAIELLLRSVERMERRWRLRRLLLLAVRVLLLAALVLAASRPFVPKPEELGGKVVARGPQHRIQVLDASMSMQAAYDGTSAFERAVARAKKDAADMGPQDRLGVVLAGAEPRLALAPSPRRADVEATLEGLEVEWGPAELGRAVTVAGRSLAEPRPEVERSIRIYSDFTTSSIRSSAVLPEGVRIELIDVVPETAERSNIALTGMELSPAPEPRTLRVRALARSHAPSGGEARRLELSLSSGANVLSSTWMDLVPGTIGERTLSPSFPSAGFVPIRIHLKPDRLRADDERFGVARVQASVRTLLVDGAPSGIPKQDEVFYVESALRVGAPDHPAPVVVTADELTEVRLQDFEVIFLVGVPNLSEPLAQSLIRFLNEGGGVFISMTESVDVDAYNELLGSVLPRPLRGLKRLGDAVGSGESAGFELLRPEHPVLEIFEGEGREGLESARSSSFILLEPSAEAEGVDLVRFSDGQPALMARSVERGRLMLLTTSLDRDMSDLPIRPGFVPLLRRSMLWLARSLDERRREGAVLGQAHRIEVELEVESLLVRPPEGEPIPLRRARPTSDFEFRPNGRPGIYEVDAPGRPDVEGLDFPVNVDVAESDLRRLPSEEVEALLSGDTGELEVARVDADAPGWDPKRTASLLLLAMTLFFVAEGFLSFRR
ncbi:MAG: BatA domain-containing protein [Myxococcota bacterium]